MGAFGLEQNGGGCATAQPGRQPRSGKYPDADDLTRVQSSNVMNWMPFRRDGANQSTGCRTPWATLAARIDRVGDSMNMKKAIASIAFGLVAASIAATGASAQATLNGVKQRGTLICGSNPALAGFGVPDAQGNWTGLDVEFCRAIAAAIFDDPNKVRFIPLSAKDRFTALQSGEVDVLARNSTATMSRPRRSCSSPTATTRRSCPF